MVRLLYLLITPLIILLFSPVTLAHSGRTNSSGCHNCNVGSCAGTYHCHNGGTPTYSNNSYTVPTKPTCGINAYYNSSKSSCICNTGYTPSTDKINCVVLPENAYSVDSTTDAWLCYSGYKEIGGKCVKDIVPTVPVIPNKVQTTTPVSNVYSEPVNNTSTDDTSALGLLGVGALGGIAYLWNKWKK